MSDYTVASDPDVAALYRAKYGHDPIVTPQSNAFSQTDPQAWQGQGNPGSMAGTGAPNTSPPAQSDPTDVLFDQAMRGHAQSGPAPAPSADPTDALFASAFQNHGHQSPQNNPQANQSSVMPMLSDVARSAGTGLAQGVASLAGMGGDARRLTDALAGYVGGPSAASAANTVQNVLPVLGAPSSSDINSVLSNAAGGYHVPTTTAGKYAQAIGTFVPAAAGGEGSLAGRLLSRAVLPALGSEGAGQLAEGSGPVGESAARIAGGLAGGAPSLARSGTKALASLLTSPISPESSNLVQAYEGLGGAIRPGQYNTSNLIRQGDSVLADVPSQWAIRGKTNPLANISNEDQTATFNRLLSNTFGENSPNLTGDLLDKARTRIGNNINTAIANNSVKDDEPLIQGYMDMQTKLDDVAPALADGDVARIQKTLNHLSTQTGADGLTGENYQSIRARGGLLQGLSDDSNTTVAKFGQDMRNMLDDAFQRQANPDDASAISLARQQYRALKTIEPLAQKAATGEISPQQTLLNRVVSEYGDPDNAGNLGTIARAGAAFLKNQSNSGTSERSFFRNILSDPLKAAGETVALPVSATIGRGLNTAINNPAARSRALGLMLNNNNRNTIPSAAMLAPLLLGRSQ